MIDREMLELAAKAAGIVPDGANPWQWIRENWNPLTDDGDAFRLAVKLDLLVLPYPKDNAVRVTRLDLQDSIVSFGSPPDPCAATRRAITRAAAEIGRAMSS